MVYLYEAAMKKTILSLIFAGIVVGPYGVPMGGNSDAISKDGISVPTQSTSTESECNGSPITVNAVIQSFNRLSSSEKRKVLSILNNLELENSEPIKKLKIESDMSLTTDSIKQTLDALKQNDSILELNKIVIDLKQLEKLEKVNAETLKNKRIINEEELIYKNIQYIEECSLIGLIMEKWEGDIAPLKPLLTSLLKEDQNESLDVIHKIGEILLTYVSYGDSDIAYDNARTSAEMLLYKDWKIDDLFISLLKEYAKRGKCLKEETSFLFCKAIVCMEPEKLDNSENKENIKDFFDLPDRNSFTNTGKELLQCLRKEKYFEFAEDYTGDEE